MLNRDDRRDLACLGLIVLVYGLAVAPVVHAVVGHGGGAPHGHVHGLGEHAHSHFAQPDGQWQGARRNAPDEDAPSAGHGPGGHQHFAGEPADSHGSRGNAPDEHAPGKGHGPGGHQHLTGSVEHLHAVAASWAVVEVPRVRMVSWVAEVLHGPSRTPGAAPRLTAMPQGP